MELPSLFELEPPRASLKKKLAKVYSMICLILLVFLIQNTEVMSQQKNTGILRYSSINS